jgi:hypothetical protein
MQVTIEVPEDIAHQFAGDLSGLSRAATEALAVEGVRSGKLSGGQARRMLGYQTRMQVDAFLKERGVCFPITAQNVENDADLSRTFRDAWRFAGCGGSGTGGSADCFWQFAPDQLPGSRGCDECPADSRRETCLTSTLDIGVPV